MEKKHKIFYSLIIISALVIVCFVTIFYISQMNQTISDNIIGSISEIAEHDKSAIQTYIEICWDDLHEIADRFKNNEYKTIEDIEKRMNLECASSSFSNLYLLAEDGTLYTDKYIPHVSDGNIVNRNTDFLPYFADGEEKIFARFDNKGDEGSLSKEMILYGIRLDHYEIKGTKMLGLIGTSDISTIRNKIVIDSFKKNGKARGHSALIDMKGNYIIDVNKEIYPNKSDNLYAHLTESAYSELTNEEVTKKLKRSETFGFYHTHEGEEDKELFYFMPFKKGMDLYFITSVNEEVFMEQTNTFVTMSMSMLIISMATVIIMLLIVMVYQNKTIRTTEKAKSQKEFLSNMSHEIRTPLNGLIGVNHLIMAHIDDDSQKQQIKEWLKKSDSTANYLLSLVNDILDMSKLQAGKVDLIIEPLLIPAMIDDIFSMQAENIKSRGVEFIVEKELPEPCVEADATRIKQILMNIVGNAAKFTPKGGYIKLTVRQAKTDDTHVNTIYTCEDTGIGISKEYIGKIFDSFSQERNKNTNGIKGTGLGMAISKLLANAMGGDIVVESELNVGSTFTVTIPSVIVKDMPDYLKNSGNEQETQTHIVPVNNEANKPLKILVAEDVELNAEVLLEILALEGFETAHAKNGKEAVDQFQASEPGEFDIILMDMQMPVMDGCTAAKEIRKLNREDAKSVMIYACTANTFQEDRDMAIASGMDDFLTKPIDINMLLKKIGRNL